MAAALQQLQEQVRELRAAVAEVRSEAAQYRAETGELRRELQATREQVAGVGAGLDGFADGHVDAGLSGVAGQRRGDDRLADPGAGTRDDQDGQRRALNKPRKHVRQHPAREGQIPDREGQLDVQDRVRRGLTLADVVERFVDDLAGATEHQSGVESVDRSSD